MGAASFFVDTTTGKVGHATKKIQWTAGPEPIRKKELMLLIK